jgi:hypothetical protein
LDGQCVPPHLAQKKLALCLEKPGEYHLKQVSKVNILTNRTNCNQPLDPMF